jgi:site-specific recombinase
VDYGNERNRQKMEYDAAEMRKAMDDCNEITRRAMQHTMNNLNELNFQAMEHTGEQLRQTMDKVNELNRNRQAFANAQQQMILQFQEKANAEGDPLKMTRLTYNHLREGISLVSHLSLSVFIS